MRKINGRKSKENGCENEKYIDREIRYEKMEVIIGSKRKRLNQEMG